MNNTIHVKFEENETYIVASEELWQYDYGQVLAVEGLELPTATEVHFSTDDTEGEAERRIGYTEDDMMRVAIPDVVLENNDAESDYAIYVFICLADADAGETQRKIRIRVRARSRPTDYTKTDEDAAQIFSEVVSIVSKSADIAATSAENAQADAETAKSAAKEAQEAAEWAESFKGDIETYAIISESWAHGHDNYPERDEDNAKFYAEVAESNATAAAESNLALCYPTFAIEDECLVVNHAERLGTTTFAINDNGELEVSLY